MDVFRTFLKGVYSACGFQVTLQRKQMQFVVQVHVDYRERFIKQMKDIDMENNIFLLNPSLPFSLTVI